MNKISSVIIFLLFTISLSAQELPVKEYAGNDNKPLIIYISGDGGYNDFTTSLCKELNAHGYPVAAVNSRSYFWKRKTPQQAAKDFGTYIEKKVISTGSRQFILLGFSFGADVIPFIVNRLSTSHKQRMMSAVMIAPSRFTNLEVYLSEMLGMSSKSGMDVLTELNKMSNMKVTMLQASDSKAIPAENVTLKNFKNYMLTGGHHFDNNINKTVNLIVNRL